MRRWHARGYRVVDPVVAYAAPVADLASPAPASMTTFPHWPPMEIASDLWAEGGIGPARLAVMDRACTGPKPPFWGAPLTAPRVLPLWRSMATRHVARAGGRAAMRRQGSAYNILRAAPVGRKITGPIRCRLVVTEANDRRAGSMLPLEWRLWDSITIDRNEPEEAEQVIQRPVAQGRSGLACWA